MKTFEHDNFDAIELKTQTVDGKRHYVTPSGEKYPSVTTVLSILSRDAIIAWRKRVGNEEANRISTTASRRGTKFHKLCEQYINNELDESFKGCMPEEKAMFKNVQSFIDNKIGRIIAQEVALYSDKLKFAGRVDLVAQWDGEYSIIDFKTSKKVKTNEQVIPYKQQICAYAVCFEEMYGIKINNGIILMSAYNASDMLAPRTNMWQFDPFCYLDDLQDTIDKYKQHRMKRQAEKLMEA